MYQIPMMEKAPLEGAIWARKLRSRSSGVTPSSTVIKVENGYVVTVSKLVQDAKRRALMEEKLIQLGKGDEVCETSALDLAQLESVIDEECSEYKTLEYVATSWEAAVEIMATAFES